MEMIFICILLLILFWYNFRILRLKDDIRRLKRDLKLLEESCEIEKLLRPKMSDVNAQIDLKLKFRDFKKNCKEYRELLDDRC